MIRGIGLRGAIAVNVITMIGIGPLITIPLVLSYLHGSAALAAWIVGALVALCDGLAWAELGSLYPGSGGTYVYLREAFGRSRLGRLLAFLFAWQIVLAGPLLLASGYIGFAHYAGYVWPPLAADARLAGLTAAGVGILTLVVLYRRIDAIGAIGVGLAGVAIATLCTVIAAAASHFSRAQAFSTDPHAGFIALGAGLGPALVITLYDYYGYGQSCTLGDEIVSPARTLPRSIVIAIGLVASLYVALQVGVLGVVPWRQLVPASPGGALPAAANYVASLVVERVWGSWPARIVTFAILVTAFASTFGNLLGLSRVPYAAAVDGVFLRPFARLEPGGRFPHVALLAIGLLALPACFLSLGDVISALTTGLVVIQSIAQLIAVAALRRRGVRAPYRMWLYPLPALVALAGWTYIFFSSGSSAIAFGVLSLGLGVIVFMWRARRAAEWPFAAKSATIAVLALGVLCAGTGTARAARGYGSSAIVERNGFPILEVRGKPFFVYGAAFFYERLPRDTWPASLNALKRLGINTLDVYVPWNWHELADGDFDFDGRTSPRRDLREVLRLARADDFEIILRPGPVIRNEWRNGGYPAWLLARPEYGMSQHDVLEGRYPATATLQNAHSDDAAAQWMRNATHLTYARRWLERVLQECDPVADRVIAIALDDDQGAYIDNQTYPAPNFQRYIGYLRDVVQRATSSHQLTFINTYQMKVPASSPVWAMGNWYQSEAYSIGEHDRAQLEFSTALLRTRPHQPLMASEFQAGWLQGPGDVRPRPADPSNTALAMATMIGLGVRGIVNFPAQDTLYPAGWEAPFANAFYAWDAALGLDLSRAARYAPTARIGSLVKRFGRQLAGAQPQYDAAIAYLGGSYAPDRATNALFSAIAERTIEAQQACRNAGLSCALVDPAASGARGLMHFPLLVVAPPALAERPPFGPRTASALGGYLAAGGRIITVTTSTELRAALHAAGRRAVIEGLPGATFARDPSHVVAGFLTVPNYGDTELRAEHGSVALEGTRRRALPVVVVAAHDALVLPVFSQADGSLRFETAASAATRMKRDDGNGASARLPASPDTIPQPYESDLPVRDDVRFAVAAPQPVPSQRAIAYRSDVYRDGAQCVVFDNALVRLVVAPDAGARAFAFEDLATKRNIFTTVGALRDDVAIEPPLSTTDRIAKYTHEFAAGTFNRTYAVDALESGPRARARFSYDAPDVVPGGATFARTLTLEANARAFTVDERFTPKEPASGAQRAVAVTSLAVGAGMPASTKYLLVPRAEPFAADATRRVGSGNALAYYDAATGQLATIAWRAGDVEDATILERRYSIVARLTLALDRTTHVRYGYEKAPTLDAADALVRAADAAAQSVER